MFHFHYLFFFKMKIDGSTIYQCNLYYSNETKLEQARNFLKNQRIGAPG